MFEGIDICKRNIYVVPKMEPGGHLPFHVIIDIQLEPDVMLQAFFHHCRDFHGFGVCHEESCLGYNVIECGRCRNAFSHVAGNFFFLGSVPSPIVKAKVPSNSLALFQATKAMASAKCLISPAFPLQNRGRCPWLVSLAELADTKVCISFLNVQIPASYFNFRPNLIHSCRAFFFRAPTGKAQLIWSMSRHGVYSRGSWSQMDAWKAGSVSSLWVSVDSTQVGSGNQRETCIWLHDCHITSRTGALSNVGSEECYYNIQGHHGTARMPS